jgi:DNA-binding CsgD family transcriptional regulator
MMPAPLTDYQKREIVRLKRSGRTHKEIANILRCTLWQSQHHWMLQTDKTYALRRRKITGTYKRVRRIETIERWRLEQAKERQIEQHNIAKRALRLEIEAAKAERATAPIFRIRPDEWSMAA